MLDLSNNPIVPKFRIWNPPVPARYADAKWDDVAENTRSLFLACRETRKGLYLYGGVGSGKTHTAYALYRSAMKVGLRTKADQQAIPRFWNTTELFRELRADAYREREEKKFVENELMELEGILFLDDVGSEKVTDWVLETFYLVVNKRYNEMLPTIYTSNYGIRELSERLGDRVASRIYESSVLVKMDGVDRRLK